MNETLRDRLSVALADRYPDAEHKRHYVSPAGHIMPLVDVIRETVDWLDRYLGVPGGGY